MPLTCIGVGVGVAVRMPTSKRSRRALLSWPKKTSKRSLSHARTAGSVNATPPLRCAVPRWEKAYKEAAGKLSESMSRLKSEASTLEETRAELEETSERLADVTARYRKVEASYEAESAEFLENFKSIQVKPCRPHAVRHCANVLMC